MKENVHKFEGFVNKLEGECLQIERRIGQQETIGQILSSLHDYHANARNCARSRAIYLFAKLF